MVNYLKPLIPRLIKDIELQNILKQIDTDVELLEALLNEVSFDEFADIFNHYYGMDFVQLKELVIDRTIFDTLDMDTLENHLVLPYEYNDSTRTYYFAIPEAVGKKNKELKDTMTQAVRQGGGRARFAFAPVMHIEKKYQELKNHKPKVSEKSSKVLNEAQIDSGDDFSAQVWVDDIINKSIVIGASDIHIEQLEHHLQVRYRVDGVMTEKTIYNLSDNAVSNINVRLKIISGMDMSERRKPQDGRIDNYSYDGEMYDLRVSTVTTIHGEKFVLRLFDKTDDTLTFEELGFSEEDTTKLRRMLNHQNGIVYVGGATGSGKTTTLYSMIDEVNNDSINTYTIENPVEKTLDDVNQIQIDPRAGVTYASTLRALLRQDPDVIVVGEIRDAETAELSVQSSLTGHLVLSTLHANGALDSINRLINIGVEPYLIIASSLGFLSQRLVRKLCTECKEKIHELKPHEEAWIQSVEEEWNITVDRSNLHRAGSCENCASGYKGRIAVVEVLEMSEEVGRLISDGASISEIRKQVLNDGFKPLILNGIDKLEAGETTIEELMRELS